MHLFTYGTLMFPEVWRRIGLGEFPSLPASLRGYEAYRMRNTVIPGLVSAGENDLISGKIYFDLDEDTLFELDAYESDLYDRIEVQVTAADGSQHVCQTYVIPESRRAALSDDLWDPVQFQQHELEKYLRG